MCKTTLLPGGGSFVVVCISSVVVGGSCATTSAKVEISKTRLSNMMLNGRLVDAFCLIFNFELHRTSQNSIQQTHMIAV